LDTNQVLPDLFASQINKLGSLKQTWHLENKPGLPDLPTSKRRK